LLPSLSTAKTSDVGQPIAARGIAERGAADVRNFKYSIIVPVFNGADKIDELFRRIAETFDSRNCRYEVVIVNDGSTDNTWEVITRAAATNPQIVAINLTKNFGQHPAVLCGLANSTGDYALTIDADLQNPPEELFKLIEPAVENKLEVVFAKFTKKRHALYRRLGSNVIYFLNEVIFGKPKDLTISNVRLLSREVVAKMCRRHTPFPYINGLALQCSNPEKRANVLVEHHKRTGSHSTYTPLRIAQLVGIILLNYAELPRVISNVGYGTAWFSFVLTTAFIAKHYFLSSAIPEFTPILVVLTGCCGILALLVGILASYGAKMAQSVSAGANYEIGSIVKGG
jgi:glycosyltransferase involved in cell wall biosynthesis